MLDLSAAFDTVEHSLLLEDLSAVGFEENVYKWYKSYLENRKVKVIVSNTESETRDKKKRCAPGKRPRPIAIWNLYNRTITNSKDTYGEI